MKLGQIPAAWLVCCFLAATVAANIVVATFGQAALPITAFILIPFDLVTRDVLHQRWHSNKLQARMAALVLAGSAITMATSQGTTQVAIASFYAFAAAGLIDFMVYSWITGSRIVKSNASNAASAVVDSLVFPAIAFGSFDARLSILQALAKFVGGVVWVMLLLKNDKTTHESNNNDC